MLGFEGIILGLGDCWGFEDIILGFGGDIWGSSLELDGIVWGMRVLFGGLKEF